MSLIHLKPPYHGRSPPLLHHKLTVPRQVTKPITNTIHNFSISTSALTIKLSSTRAAANSGKFISPFTCLSPLKPYLLSEWKPILCGWLCSVISVYSLSKIVPKVGKFSSLMNPLDVVRLREECLVLGGLFFVRLVGNYLQQAFLWEAALNCVYKMRVCVFHKVLQRDLGFFEGESGIAAGDVAYRITAEASDVADTVYSLLNTIVPSSLQLSAMAVQMLVINPVLSLLSALVIPLMGFAIGYLGEKLRDVSNKAHLAAASLSSYLNEILPSILFVKANNAESCERKKFQSLAFADLSATMGKKKLKSFIPLLVQAIYFGTLFTFSAGTLLVSKGSIDCSAMVSFVTSLVLLISPIQDVGKAYNELKQGEPAIQRLFSLSRFEPEEIVNPDAVDLVCVAGEVKYSSVSFRYGDNGPLVLKSIDLHIKSGEIVALCGPSGGGKTTLVKLLLRLYDPLQGSILIDGLDIRDIQIESLRRNIGLVSQDTVLVIAHRLETVLMAERVLLLEDGYLREVPRSSLLDGQLA